MQCPECKSKLTVRDTDDFGSFVIRVRNCPTCRCRIDTTEVVTAYRPAEVIVQHASELQKSA